MPKSEENLRDLLCSISFNIGRAAGLNFAIRSSFRDLKYHIEETCITKREGVLSLTEEIDHIDDILNEQQLFFEKIYALNQKNGETTGDLSATE